MRALPEHLERIEAVQKTRKAAARALARVFAADIQGRSEVEMCSQWLSALRRSPSILPYGWYQPPPGGASILTQELDDVPRLDFQSLSDMASWPKKDRYENASNIFYCYASPVDCETAMMGDLAVTLYKGPDIAIRNGLSKVLEITSGIVDRASVGMTFDDLYRFARELGAANGLENTLHSRDRPDLPNIGHTIPWLSSNYSEAAVSWLAKAEKDDIGQLLSKSRVFVRKDSFHRIAETDGFTIEPRFRCNGLPILSFHVIVMFYEGRKIVCAEFKELFELFGMREFLPYRALNLLGCA